MQNKGRECARNILQRRSTHHVNDPVSIQGGNDTKNTAQLQAKYKSRKNVTKINIIYSRQYGFKMDQQ